MCISPPTMRISLLVSFPLLLQKAVMYSNCFRNYKYIFKICIFIGGKIDSVVQKALHQVHLSKGGVSPSSKWLALPLCLECWTYLWVQFSVVILSCLYSPPIQKALEIVHKFKVFFPLSRTVLGNIKGCFSLDIMKYLIWCLFFPGQVALRHFLVAFLIILSTSKFWYPKSAKNSCWEHF